ncbi:MAG: SprT family zinc-dependent metalloprotease [Nitrospirota bacterium]|nr:SprT family zinc-dependent metalloprotease [Nitrospirota bacterium]
MNRRHKNIDYTLKRSKRKTASIQIERNGQVSLRVPMRMLIRDIETLIAEKEGWILRHLAQRKKINLRKNERYYLNGERFPYLGKSYVLKIVGDQSQPLLLKSGFFCLRTDHQSPAKAAAAFKAFYREKGLIQITERVAHFQMIMGVQANRIRMVETKTRWASCSSKGNLNFHWKCLILPKKVFDYIIVHEVAHLVHLNHSKRFWIQLEKIMGDYQEYREWLRLNGAEMEL